MHRSLARLSAQKPKCVAVLFFLLDSLLTFRLLFLALGLWFLHPVNYLAENEKRLGMWVSIAWPRDTHSFSWELRLVRSH